MIKYRLLNLGKQLLFQILEMDESQRATRGENDGICSREFQGKTGDRVKSNGRPDLQFNGIFTVFVRGILTDQDSHACLYSLDSKQEVENTIKRIHAILEEWVLAGGFENKYYKPVAKEIETGVWEI